MGEPPYNGDDAAPRLRLVARREAEAAGAELVCSTTATGLLRDGDRVVGVRTDRPDGDLTAEVVIACDGVNSFLAKEAGLNGEVDAANYTVGVKETIALPRDLIDERFAVRGDHGVDIEILGCTGDVPGGGFVYTNAESLAVGLVLQLPALAAGGRRPEELLAALKAHPAIAPLVEGGEVKGTPPTSSPRRVRHDAELIGDGSSSPATPPRCASPRASGWRVNFAIGSGAAAGRAAARAIRRRDTSAEGLAGYRTRLESSFVLADHRKLRDAPKLVMSDFAQRQVPGLLCGAAEQMFQVTDPDPKPGLLRILREMKRNGVKARDARMGLRAGDLREARRCGDERRLVPRCELRGTHGTVEFRARAAHITVDDRKRVDARSAAASPRPQSVRAHRRRRILFNYEHASSAAPATVATRRVRSPDLPRGRPRVTFHYS